MSPSARFIAAVLFVSCSLPSVSGVVHASIVDRATLDGATDLSTQTPKGHAPIRVNGDDMHGVTFSELIYREVETGDIGVAKEGFKISILESKRSG